MSNLDKCEGKARFTAEKARKIAASMRRRKSAKINAYRCEFCRNFHVGRRSV